MSNRRTHVIMPEQLVAEIDSLVGRRGRSQFLVGAATYELKRQRQLAVLRAATGAWKLADHPKLKGGSVAYQRKLRAESERRLKRQTARSVRP
jgi:hypothetical protein